SSQTTACHSSSVQTAGSMRGNYPAPHAGRTRISRAPVVPAPPCRSGPPAAEPPEAEEPGEGHGEGQEDPGLDSLQGPVATAGLVGDGRLNVPPLQALPQRWRGRALLDPGRGLRKAGGGDGAEVDGLPRRVDASAGEDPGTGVTGDDGGGERADVDRLHGRERGGRVAGRDEVRADPQRRGDLDGGEDGQGDGHGGQRAPDEGAG